MTDTKKKSGTRFSGVVGRTPTVVEPEGAPDISRPVDQTAQDHPAPEPVAPVPPPVSVPPPVPAAALEPPPQFTAPVPKVRPLSKKADRENYTQVTVYLRKDVYKAARKILIDDDREVSDLVNDLVSHWVASRSAQHP